MTHVKICGIRRLEDARFAIAEGAWAIGFIFHRASPRFIEPGRAAELVRALREMEPEIRPDDMAAVLTAGVFVDLPVSEVQRIVDEVGLDVAQLHGHESPADAAALEVRDVWKAFRVGAGFEPSQVQKFPPEVTVLLDTYREGRPGGTGETFDWGVARKLAEKRRVVLAGGLHERNVGDAVAHVRPFAVDVSSGVELEPGFKDHERIRAFLRAVERGAR